MAPSLNIGATLAIFQLSGNRPRERDKLNSCAREGAKTEIPVFRKKLEIESTPDPFEVSIPTQTLSRVSSFIGGKQERLTAGWVSKITIEKRIRFGRDLVSKIYPNVAKEMVHGIGNRFSVSDGFITIFKSPNVSSFRPFINYLVHSFPSFFDVAFTGANLTCEILSFQCAI